MLEDNVSIPFFLIIITYQGRYFSLLCFAMIIMAALAPSATAGSVFVAKNKDDAVTKCQQEYNNAYGIDAVYRDGPQGNDILYSCRYKDEIRTDLNRSKKCDSKTTEDSRKYLQNTLDHYDCSNDGKLHLLECDLVPVEPTEENAGMMGSQDTLDCHPLPGYQ